MAVGFARALGVAIVVVGAIGTRAQAATLPEVNAEMAAAAKALLAALPSQQRNRCALAFDGPEREDWSNLPRVRPGVALREMDEAGRDAALALMRTALSPRGIAAAENIMYLDAVLHEREVAAGGDGATRDPLAYNAAVFGTPGDGKPWGWKFEGHHLSINITWPTPDTPCVTPLFLGANPANLNDGPRTGLRTLGAEEDLARSLLASLDDAERAKAVFAPGAPGDYLTQAGCPLDPEPQAGLAGADMTEPQRRALEGLVREYAGNLRPELAEPQVERALAGGLEAVRFVWAGGAKAGEGHYYRVTGPTFVIEYVNTQDGAHHIHSVWHDRQRDFAHDLLTRPDEPKHTRKDK